MRIGEDGSNTLGRFVDRRFEPSADPCDRDRVCLLSLHYSIKRCRTIGSISKYRRGMPRLAQIVDGIEQILITSLKVAVQARSARLIATMMRSFPAIRR